MTLAKDDAATDDALPLLAFALRELYERFKSTGTLSAAAYRALGDKDKKLSPLDNAVRQRADEVLQTASPNARELQAEGIIHSQYGTCEH